MKTTQHTPKHIRSCYGFTQAQMARLLGISTSMIKKVEACTRRLGATRQARLDEMEQQLDLLIQSAQHTETQPACPQQEAQQQLDAAYHHQRCMYKAKLLRKQLKKMECEREALQYQLALVEAYEQLRPASLPAGLNLQRRRLVKKLMTCNGYAQSHTQKKIALLHAEAALYDSGVDPDDATQTPFSHP